MRSDSIELRSPDLPVVIECVDTGEKVRATLPELAGVIGGGLITLEPTRVILYRADVSPDRRTDSWPVDLT